MPLSGYQLPSKTTEGKAIRSSFLLEISAQIVAVRETVEVIPGGPLAIAGVVARWWAPGGRPPSPMGPFKSAESADPPKGPASVRRWLPCSAAWRRGG